MTRGPIASQVRVKILLYVIIDIPIDALAGIVRELVRSNFIVSKGQWWNGGKIQCNNTECCSHEESQNCTGWKMTCRISCSIIFPWMEWGRMGGSFLAPSPCPFLKTGVTLVFLQSSGSSPSFCDLSKVTEGGLAITSASWVHTNRACRLVCVELA